LLPVETFRTIEVSLLKNELRGLVEGALLVSWIALVMPEKSRREEVPEDDWSSPALYSSFMVVRRPGKLFPLRSSLSSVSSRRSRPVEGLPNMLAAGWGKREYWLFLLSEGGRSGRLFPAKEGMQALWQEFRQPEASSTALGDIVFFLKRRSGGWVFLIVVGTK
jgi:hypothetical protein